MWCHKGYWFLTDSSHDTPNQVFAAPSEDTSGPPCLCALPNTWEVEQSRSSVKFLLEAVNRQLLCEYTQRIKICVKVLKLRSAQELRLRRLMFSAVALTLHYREQRGRKLPEHLGNLKTHLHCDGRNTLLTVQTYIFMHSDVPSHWCCKPAERKRLPSTVGGSGISLRFWQSRCSTQTVQVVKVCTNSAVIQSWTPEKSE